ncbi:MAG: ABC transporter substrate-binding protein [Anaerolineales bacterium]|jgi:iron complex transport system substrate-binding protein|nr:ABC transporter substrate-binding protein [Anaerolineales bacterium]
MLRKLTWLLILAFLLGACAAPAALEPTTIPAVEPITLTDGLDRSVTLAAGAAQRVVSLAPSNTEILFAVGAGSQVVGRDEFSNYPTEALALPSVGGSMGNYNAEAIVSLKPDLVLAAEINPPELVENLAGLGLVVYLLPNPTDIEGVYTNLLTVSQLTGHQAEAETLVASLRQRVQAVEEKVAILSYAPIVFYELDATDPNAPYTTGPGTFMDLLIRMAGGINAANQSSSAWAQFSTEELLVQDPQVILLGDAAYGVTVEAVQSRPGWEGLAAVQNGRIYPFNDDLVSRPGPRLVDGLEELAKLLHPEQFDTK